MLVNPELKAMSISGYSIISGRRESYLLYLIRIDINLMNKPLEDVREIWESQGLGKYHFRSPRKGSFQEEWDR